MSWEMAIVWLCFDQVLQIGGEVVGGLNHMAVAQSLYTSSYTENLHLEHKSSYAEKLVI